MRIYHLSDPRDGQVRYVGATSCTLRRRLNTHISKRVGSTPRHLWLSELFVLGLRPLITLIAECDKSTVNSEEQRWIEHYRAAGFEMLNQDGAAPGIAGVPLDDAQRAAASAWRTGAQYFCKDPAEKSRKISERLRGRQRTPEHAEKLALQLRGKSRLPLDKQQRIRELHGAGCGFNEIGRQVGCSRTAVEFIINGPRLDKYKLTLAQLQAR